MPRLYNYCFFYEEPKLSLSQNFSFSLSLSIKEENSTYLSYSKPMPSKLLCSFHLKRPSKGHNVRVHQLNRWRRSRKEVGMKNMVEMDHGVETEMEIKNLKLYMENQSIIEENERLRKKALLLREENESLLAQLQKKLSQSSLP